MIKFELPFATPSNNVIMRQHHRERSAEHKRYYYLVMAAITGQDREQDKCSITVIRHGARGLDYDNMGGGLKFLFDAMVKNKIIKDDSPKYVTELNLRQIKCKRKDEKTVIVIEGV